MQYTNIPYRNQGYGTKRVAGFGLERCYTIRMKRLYAILLGVSLILTGCGRAAAPAAVQSVTLTTQTRESSGERWSAKLEYPVISGLQSAEKERALNDAIRSFVATTESRYRSTAESAQPPLDSSYDNEFMLTFDPYLVNQRVVSLLWSDYSFTGGAHGGTAIIPFLWDIDNARALSLEDFFTADTNYLEQLSAATRTELKTQHPDWDAAQIDDGTAAKADNFSTISLSQDALAITFAQYQVGPYVVGTPVVTIPLKRLEKILNTPLLDRLLMN